MAELKIRQEINNPMNFRIGSSSVYAEQIRNKINKKIGGVYTIGTEFRNANLMYNPMTLRYKNHENAQGFVDGADVGEIYRIEDKNRLTHFLDEESGLVGFTFGDYTTKPGYENSINTGVRQNFDEVKHHQGEFFTENYKFLYDTEQHEGVENPYIYEEKLNRLDKVYPGRFYGLYSNLTPEQGTLAKIDNAIFMAQQTSFEKNSTVVARRYMLNGGGYKFDAEYTTDLGRNYSLGGRDLSGLKNRIVQLYSDVFGIPEYSRANIFNRFINRMIYNPALPLNPINGEGFDFKRNNPIPELVNSNIFELYSVDDRRDYKPNEIFYGGKINGYSTTEYTIDKLNRVYDDSRYFRDENLYDNTKEYTPRNQYVVPSSQNTEDDRYVVYEKNTNNFYSVDTPSYSQGFGEIVEPKPSNTGSGIKETINYGLYDERNGESEEIYNEDGSKNYESTTTVSLLDTDDFSKNSLIKKTNELFQKGKIHSIINRFHTDVSEGGLTESAIDYKYNLSRGRNLRKRVTDTHNGYDDPYCRVWTSHYQYSKMNDLIRNKGYGDEHGNSDLFLPLNSKLRPNNSIKRLSAFSSLQDNGLPLIAPYKGGKEGFKPNDLIKRCMFSIENLAWKDITLNGKTNTLTKEQIGPNGGRIMWFPPYNLRFNENVNTNWNPNSFIGRGEQIYTYTNTERGGTLSFTILIDHPSVVDSWAYGKDAQNITEDDELQILRFFAGCDDGNIGNNGESNRVQEKELKDEEATKGQKKREPDNVTTEITTPAPKDMFEDKTLRYFVFFPNDFSGVDYVKNNDINTPIEYLYSGKTYGVNGYEMNAGDDNGLKGCINSSVITQKVNLGGGRNGINEWHYEVDNSYSQEILEAANYYDKRSFGLNSSNFVSLLEGPLGSQMMSILNISKDEIENDNIRSFEELLGTDFTLLTTFYSGVTEGNISDDEFEVTAEVKGFASSHGYAKNNLGTSGLAGRRAKVLKEYLCSQTPSVFINGETINVVDNGVVELPKGNKDVSSLEAKLGRYAEVRVSIHRKELTPALDAVDDGETKKEDIDQNKTEIIQEEIADSIVTSIVREYAVTDGSYDNEYLYFKKINNDENFIKKRITEKVQYFDPAFHSITPEGFNGRLTFLHQCTRQGPTNALSDMSASQPRFAGNLSFGRPPVCVLRIGDFYNTKIIIDSLTITYDNNGITWDLNPEGAGIQPMLANVDMTFKFLGGSDISGPIARLQNAVSFNYYANASSYDRRADYRNNYIQKNDDTALAWNAMTDVHTPFQTINDGIVDKTQESFNIHETNREKESDSWEQKWNKHIDEITDFKREKAISGYNEAAASIEQQINSEIDNM